jgi:hypothetical protein
MVETKQFPKAERLMFCEVQVQLYKSCDDDNNQRWFDEMYAH